MIPPFDAEMVAAAAANLANLFIEKTLYDYVAELGFPGDPVLYDQLEEIPEENRRAFVDQLKLLMTTANPSSKRISELIAYLIEIPLENRNVLIQAVKALAKVGESEENLAWMLNKLKEVRIEDIDQCVEQALSLISDKDSCEDRVILVRTIYKIPQHNRIDSISSVKEFYRNDDPDFKYKDFLEECSDVPVGAIKDLFALTNDLLKDCPENHLAKARVQILSTSSYIYSSEQFEINEIVENARLLLKKNDTFETRCDLLATIKDIPKTKRVQVIAQGKKLFADNLSTKDCIEILKFIRTISSAKREKVVEFLSPFVGNQAGVLRKIREIFRKISDEDERNDIIQHSLLITDFKPNFYMASIVEGLEKIPRKARPGIVKQVKSLPSAITIQSRVLEEVYDLYSQSEGNSEDVIKRIHQFNSERYEISALLIKAIGNIPIDERDELCRQLKPLFTNITSDWELANFFKFAGKIPNNNREEIIQHAKPWLDLFPNLSCRPDLLRTYFQFCQKMSFEEVDDIFKKAKPILLNTKGAIYMILDSFLDVHLEKIEALVKASETLSKTVNYSETLANLLWQLKNLPVEEISDLMDYTWLFLSVESTDGKIELLTILISLSIAQRKTLCNIQEYLNRQKDLDKIKNIRIAENILKIFPANEWQDLLEPLCKILKSFFEEKIIMQSTVDLSPQQRKDFLVHLEKLSQFEATALRDADLKKLCIKTFVKVMPHVTPEKRLDFFAAGLENQLLYDRNFLTYITAADSDVLKNFYIYLNTTLAQIVAKFSKDSSQNNLYAARAIARELLDTCKAYEVPEGIEIEISGFYGAVMNDSHTNNPFILFQKLKEILQKEELINKVGSWDLEIFRSRSKPQEYTFADLPKIVSYQTLKDLLETWKKRFQQLSKEQQNELESYIRGLCDDNTLTIDSVIVGILQKSEVLRLFHLQGLPEDKVESLAFYFYKVIESIAEESDAMQEGSPLTQKEERLLGLFREFNGCTIGQQDGIISCYNARPQQAKDEKEKVMRPAIENIESMIDSSVLNTLKEILGEKNETILRNLLKVNQVGQQVHLGRYLLNRFSKQFGWNDLTFDIHTQVIPKELIDMNSVEALPIILGGFFTENVIKRLQVSFKENLKAIDHKKEFIKKINELKKQKTDELTAFESDLEKLKAQLTELKTQSCDQNSNNNDDYKIQQSLKWLEQKIVEEKDHLNSQDEVITLRNEIDNLTASLREEEAKVLSMVSGSGLYEFLGLKSMDQAEAYFELKMDDALNYFYEGISEAGAKALLQKLGYFNEA